MKTYKTSKKIIYLASTHLLAVVFVSMFGMAVFADPVSTPITCSDGTKVQATHVGATFVTSDYVTACGSHGYTAPVSATPTVPTNTTDPLAEANLRPLNFSGTSAPAGSTPIICGSDGIKGNATADSDNVNEVHVAFSFGCLGDDYDKPLNPIIDIAFAIFRFLSAGVGLIVIGSIIVAGIQYSASRGNPQATEASIKRISNSVIALLLYIFIFSIANFLIPGGMLRG